MKRKLAAASCVVAVVLGTGAGSGDVRPAFPGEGSRSFAVLEPLLLAPGVSGQEAKVRDAIRKLLPAWARQAAVVDERGNLLLRAGAGGERLLFIAHMDETGYEIQRVERDGTARVKSLGGFFNSLYEAQAVVVHTRSGEVPAVVRPRQDYLNFTGASLSLRDEEVVVDFGTEDSLATRRLGVTTGDWITVAKKFRRLAGDMGSGRSVDDRAGCAALVEAVRRLDPKVLKNRVTFAWSVEEEIGLKGAAALAAQVPFDAVFAVDTFVSSDSPLETPAFALGVLGAGPVLRAMDNSNLAPAAALEKLQRLAGERRLPLQIGLTHGGNDGSVFPAYGAVDVPLSWPTTYSHSAVELIHQRDLDNLARLVALVAQAW